MTEVGPIYKKVVSAYEPTEVVDTYDVRYRGV